MPEIMFTKPMPSLSPRSLSGRTRRGKGGKGGGKKKEMLLASFMVTLTPLFSLAFPFCAHMRDKDAVLVMQIPACARSGASPRREDPVSRWPLMQFVRNAANVVKTDGLFRSAM